MTGDALGLLGTTVADKYDVERVVGEGGFAVVYRAEHRLWKRPVALKVFRALADLPAEAREELTQNFIREGALLAELSEKSASICQARDVGVLTASSGISVPYMVLEWLEGESLEEALQRELKEALVPRSLLETVRLLDPVADALALAHARGIAHRDVKPANIFLLGGARDERCPVKLLDFGIAKVVQDIQKADGAFTKTSGTITSFTPAYAAPEQFSRTHGPTGPWTDVFALALVAVELLTGRPPLDGDDFGQLGFAASDPAVRPTPRTRGAMTSDAVEAVFARALAVDRTARYASAGLFWQDLRAAVDLPPASMAVPSTASPSARDYRAVVEHGVEATGQTVAVVSAAVSAPFVAAPSTTLAAPAAPNPGRRLLPFVVGVGLVAGVAVVLALRSGVSRAPHSIVGHGPVTPVSSSTVEGPPPASVPTGGPCPDGMVLIPGGPFFMGADDGLPAERPAHKVQVAPFCMDIHEVTTARYVACSDAGWCKRASTTNTAEGLLATEQGAYDSLCNERDPAGRAQHPINCVSWEMADVFCRSNHERLPTEAEWEFAARGSDGRTYPWGDAPPGPKLLNACGPECTAWAVAAKVSPVRAMYDAADGWPNTAPVGSFPEGRSKFGVLDLAGNVWEWVADWYGAYAPGDGVRAEADPKGPDRGERRVIRGGGWNGSDPSWERPSFRYSKEPESRNHGVGFRCVATPR